MVIKMLFGKFVPDCVRSNLRGSKFSWGGGGGGGGEGGMSPDPPSRHACESVRGHAFARYYHPATISGTLRPDSVVLRIHVYTSSQRK